MDHFGTEFVKPVYLSTQTTFDYYKKKQIMLILASLDNSEDIFAYNDNLYVAPL